MKRRFNFRLFAWLLGAFVVLAPGVHFVHAFQVKRNASFLLDQADKCEQGGELQKAADYYRRYLALDPSDSQNKALVRYGTLLAGEKMAKSPKQLAAAYFVLERALRRNPEMHDVRKQVVKIAMNGYLQRYTDALDHLDALEPVADAEIYTLRGECLVGLRRFKEARAAYEKAIDRQDKKYESFLELAGLLRTQDSAVRVNEKDLAEVQKRADDTVTAMLETFGDSYEARLGAARYYRQFADKSKPEEYQQKSDEQINKARALAPDKLEVILAYAEMLQTRKEPAKARTELERGLALYAEKPTLYQALAHLEMLDEKPEAALAALRRGLDKMPTEPDLQWNLAHLLIHQGKIADANDVVNRLASQGFPTTELDYLKARMRASEEKWQSAVQMLEAIYPLLVGRSDQGRDWLAISLVYETNLLLARCYEQLGDLDAALSAYNRLVTRFPTSPVGRLGLARTEWSLGRLDNAVREYNLLMTLPQAPPAAWVECAQVLIDRNMKLSRPDWDAVTRILKEAEKLKTVEIDLLRAETLAAQGNFDSARAVLEKAHPDIDARPVEVWVGLSNLEQRQGKQDLALAILSDAEKRLGDRVELRQARCRYWARRGGPEAPRALDQISQGLDQFKGDQQRRLLRLLASSYLHIGETKRAESMWQQVAKKHENDLGSRLALFDLAFRENEQMTMTELVGAIREIEGPEGTVWRYCQACKLIAAFEKSRDAKILAEAEELLAAVEKRRPTWTRLLVAQAEISDLSGKVDAAISRYMKLIKAHGEDAPAIIRRAVQLLSARERFDDAELLIEDLRAQTKAGLGDLDRVSAEIALRKEDPGQALGLAEKAVTPNSKDYKDHLWLARIEWAAGKNAEAEKEIRQAVALAPQAADPWVALIFHYTRIGEKDKAESALAQAEQKLPKERSSLALAQCFEMIGNSKRSKELYDAALAANPDDSEVLRHLAFACLRNKQLTEAKRHLERIIDLKNSPAYAEEAKRLLAFVLASGPNYQESVKALRIMGVVNFDADALPLETGESAADQRTKILILAKAQNPRQRRQAINLLEGLQRQQQISTDEHFLLAQLYHSVGNWYRAREEYLFVLNATQERLRKESPDRPALLRRFADQLAVVCNGFLVNGDPSDVEPWLVKLEEIEPKELRAVALRARLLHKQGKSDQAVPLLLALEKERKELTAPIAGVLEQIQQPKQAEELFKKFVEQSMRGEASLTLARFYGRQHRPDEALTLCEQALKSCALDEVTSSAVLILYTSGANDQHCRKVAGWLEDGIKKNSKAGGLMTSLAAVRRLQQDYPGVIALYRDVLKVDPNDTLALNNLAWLLALSERNGPDALKVIERAIELDGPQAELLDTRAVAYLVQGEAVRALKDIDEAIAENPTAHRYFHRAQAHHLAKNESAATDDLRKALQMRLSETTIDPLERTSYRQLLADLGVKATAQR